MKVLIYLLFISTILLLQCNNNPTNTNQDSIITESKTISESFDYYRDSLSNSDTLIFSLESSNPDVYVFANFYLTKRNIISYNYTILQIDTPAIKSFMIKFNQNHIELLWSTRYENNNRGWEIQRKNSNQTYQTIAFVNGSGTSVQQKDYSYTDVDVVLKEIFYRFKQIDFDGNYNYSLETRIEIEAVDSVKARFSVSAQNGVIIYDGEIAPDSGYTYNLPIDTGDLIYFKNSFSHYGKIRLRHFNFINEPFLNIDESHKNLSYQLGYEIFLQTNGNRTFF